MSLHDTPHMTNGAALAGFLAEYDTMDLEMLREVVPMLRQQLEKSMLDRNYVQLEKVGGLWRLDVDLHP